MATTVAEVGRLAGCSSATVSRALNNSGLVSPKTREVVLKVLRETQYVVRRGPRRKPADKASARGLVEVVLHRRSPIERLSLGDHGLEVAPPSNFPDSPEAFSKPYQLSNSFYRRIVDGVVEELTRWGHRAVLQFNGDLLNPQFLAEANQPDRQGVLLIGESSPDLDRFIGTCLRPLVLVDLMHDGSPDVVTTDNITGAGLAFDHLYSLGHRRIGFVGRNDQVFAYSERFNGFHLKCIQAGLPLDPQWIVRGPNQIEVTAENVAGVLRRSDRPTAFVCSNDCAALGVLRAAGALGIRCPEELSLVGFDDQEVAALVTPALTTVRVPMVEMGRQAVRQLMIQMMRGPEAGAPGCHVRLMPELVIRQSTAPVSQ